MNVIIPKPHLRKLDYLFKVESPPKSLLSVFARSVVRSETCSFERQSHDFNVSTHRVCRAALAMTGFWAFRSGLKVINKNAFSLGLMIVIFLLLPVGYLNASGLDFGPLLRVGETMNYQHWNIRKKKVTGYTLVSFEAVLIDDKAYIMEINQNQHENKEVYSEKKSWFDSKTGEQYRYEEKDFRTGIEIVNSFTKNEIKTIVKEKKQTSDFTIKVEPNLVPFEVLTLSLRKEMPSILKEQSYHFTLYLPVIASELVKKGLPVSLSKLSMIATIETFRVVDSVLGTLKAVQILVKPGSFLISALLPRDKSEFRFVFAVRKPYYLLSFEEGETRSVLFEAQNLRK